MKKIFALVWAITMLSACSSSDDPNPNPPNPPITEWDGDWNDSQNPNYAEYDGEYNPIEGEWIVTNKNGALSDDFLVYKFDRYRLMYLATVKPDKDKEPKFGKSVKYIINDKAFKTDNTIYKYTVASDKSSLEITDGTDILYMKPYESGAWKWKGDWNDPDDPHYAIYQGKYNPIVGRWRLTHVGGTTVQSGFQCFNEDFTVENPSNPTSKRRYWINDTGVKEDNFNIHKSYTYSYRIEGDTLYYRTMLPSMGEGMRFVRYDR